MVKFETIPSYTDGEVYRRNGAKIIFGNFNLKNFREEQDFVEVYLIKKSPVKKIKGKLLKNTQRKNIEKVDGKGLDLQT